MDKCPCCGQALPETSFEITFSDRYRTVWRNGLCAELTKLQYNILKALKRHGMPRSELIDTLYAHRSDGGPETAISVMYVTINKANQRLKPLGIKISSDRLGAYETPYRIRVLNA